MNVSVSDNSLCLEECLKRNCKMFSYNDDSDDCKLYDTAIGATETEDHTNTALYERMCISAGTGRFMLFKHI